jgi:hypothetical protein
MPETATTVHLRSTYDWPVPDLAALVAALLEDVAPVAGEGYRFYGTLAWEAGAQVERRYEAVEAWAAAFASDTAQATASFSSSDGVWRFHAWTAIADGDLSFTIDVPENAVPEATRLTAALERRIGIEPRRPPSELQREFRRDPGGDAGWCSRALAVMRSHMPARARFSGSVKTRSPAQTREHMSEEAWLADVAAHLSNLMDVWCRLERRPLRLQLHLAPERDAVQVFAAARTGQDAEAMLARLAGELSLREGKPDNPAVAGLERRGFVRGTLDRSWFERAVATLAARFSREQRFDGRFRLAGAPENAVTRGSPSAWRQDVVARWDEVTESSAYLTSPALSVRFRLDHLRQWVTLEVQASTDEESRAAFDALATALDLELTPDDPYRRPRSTCTLRIDGWSNDAFGRALTIAVRQFVGERPAIVDAAIIEAGEDKGRSVLGFTDWTRFVMRICEARAYDEVTLLAQGPHGRSLRVNATAGLRQLVLKSHLTTDELPHLEKIFQRELTLTPVAAGEDEPATPKQPASRGDGLGSKAVLAMLSAALGLGLSTGFVTAAVPRAEVHITSPRSAKERTDAAPVAGPDIAIDWQVQIDRWFRTREEWQRAATVRVLRDGLDAIPPLRAAMPGTTVKLAPGRYEIRVIVEDLGKSDWVLVDVGSSKPRAP